MRNAWSFCSKGVRRETPSLHAEIESHGLTVLAQNGEVHENAILYPSRYPAFTVQGHPGGCGVYQDKQ